MAIVIPVEGHTFVVAEHPKRDNATYILRTDLAEYGATWKEVFEQSRQFARLLGAEQVVHDPRRSHLDAILDRIQSKILVKPPQAP